MSVSVHVQVGGMPNILDLLQNGSRGQKFFFRDRNSLSCYLSHFDVQMHFTNKHTAQTPPKYPEDPSETV